MKTTFRQDLPDVLPERMPSEDFPNCFMVRRSDFDAVGGFDAIRFPQHMEEADLARRLFRSTGSRAYVVPQARVWHHIETQLAQRLHLRNAKRAWLCAHGRAMFTAIHGDRLQWIAYLVAAQWLFAAFYIGAALSVPSGNRRGVVSGYIRGLRAGLIDGWRARNQDRRAAPSVQMRSGN
jgi:GT2 family glycosyltransferase